MMLTNSKPEYIVAALGNFGDKFENTRHNAGFIAADYLIYNLDIKIKNNKFISEYGNFLFKDKSVLLLKPKTFMNESGQAVFAAMSYYKIVPENVLVILDDISFSVGTLRIRRNGSHAGHNGMRSIIKYCKSDKIPRIKIGVGQKPDIRFDLADWVLSRFSSNELKLLHDETLKKVKNSIELIINGKIEEAMNLYN